MKPYLQSIFQRDEILTLIIFTFCYLAYHFSYEYKWISVLAIKLGDSETRKEYAVHIRRTFGFLLLGIIPLIIAVLFYSRDLGDYGFRFISGKNSLIISIISITVFLVVSLIRSGKGIDTSYYPQVRVPVWNRRSHALNILTWTLYLFGYEFILRGLLFFTFLHSYDLVTAIAINCVIYSLIHIFKGKGEAFGTIFLGIILCLLAYYTNSFLLPFILHVTIAVINDMKAIKHQLN